MLQFSNYLWPSARGLYFVGIYGIKNTYIIFFFFFNIFLIIISCAPVTRHLQVLFGFIGK